MYSFLLVKALAAGKAMPKRKARTQVVNALVSGSRKPHTTVTSTWADGTAGPLMLSFKAGDVSMKAVRAINDNPENAGVIHIYVTKTDSHFMCSDATHYYFNNVLAPASWLHLVKKNTHSERFVFTSGRKPACSYMSFTHPTVNM